MNAFLHFIINNEISRRFFLTTSKSENYMQNSEGMQKNKNKKHA
jgi:hypothetical protein